MKTRINILLIIVISFSCNENESDLYREYIKQYEESIRIIENVSIKRLKRIDRYYEIRFKRNFSKNLEMRKITKNALEFVDSIIQTQTNLENEKENKSSSNKVKINIKDLSFLKRTYQNIINYGLSIIKPDEYDSTFKTRLRKSFELKNCKSIDKLGSNNMNYLELKSVLLKIKLNLVSFEEVMLSYAYSFISDCGIRYHDRKVMYIPSSQIVKQNEIFHAEIYFAAYDSTLPLEYEIEGKKYSGTNSKIIYKHKVTENPGSVEKKGNIIIKLPRTGKIEKFPFRIKYEVIE